MEIQIACFTCGRRRIGQQWNYYKRLRWQGYSESEALDEAQIKTTCCRTTVATQTDVNARVYASGRPVTQDSGKRTVEGITRYPDIDSFGVVTVNGKKPELSATQEPSADISQQMTFEVIESFKTRRSDSARVLMGLEFKPDRLPKNFGSPGDSRESSRRVLRRAITPGMSLTGDTDDLGDINTNQLGLNIASPEWSKIAWDIGESYDISQYDDRFFAPILPKSKSLKIFVQVVSQAALNLTIAKDDYITGSDVLNEVDKFVNVGLESGILDQLISSSLNITNPYIIWSIHLSRQSERNASLRELRLNAGAPNLNFVSFKRKPRTRFWLLGIEGLNSDKTDFDEVLPELTGFELQEPLKVDRTDDTNVNIMLNKADDRLELTRAKHVGLNVSENFDDVVGTEVLRVFRAPSQRVVGDAFGTDRLLVIVLSDKTMIITSGDIVFRGERVSP